MTTAKNSEFGETVSGEQLRERYKHELTASEGEASEMKSDTELLQELDMYAAAFTVAAVAFELEQIDLVWSNDAHRQTKLNLLIARGARLLGNVGVTINPQYRVLAEAERASAEGFLKGLATVIQIEAMQHITGCEIEISESGHQN